MNKNFSNNINWLKGILCLLVVFVHAQNTWWFNMESAPWIADTELFMVQLGAYAGVSGFFFLSGYLFFRNISIQLIAEKLKRRVKTLLIPLLLWNAFYYLMYLSCTRLPGIRSLFDGMYIPFTFSEIFQALINYKYNPVFWFMQYLIIYMILTPIFWLLLKNRYIGLIFIAAVFIISCGFYPEGMSSFLSNISDYIKNAVGFLAGGYMVIHCRGVFETDRNDKQPAIQIAAAAILFALFIWYEMTEEIVLLQCVRLLSGICLLMLFGPMELPDPPGWMKYTFYIYAVHQILIHFMNKAAGVLISNNAYFGLFLFLTLPLLAIWFCGITGPWLTAHCPHLCAAMGISFSKEKKSGSVS